MKQFILSLFIGLWASVALAYNGLDTPFDARALTGAEKRSLQAMLSHSGHYTARLDGAWGRGSQSALMRALQMRQTPSWRDVAIFVQDETSKMERANWRVQTDERANVSFLLPTQSLQPVAINSGLRFRARDNSLQVYSQTASIPNAIRLHESIRRQGTRGKADYSINRETVFVTTVTRPNGVKVYARSERVGSRFGSVVVEWSAAQSGAAQVIISSIQKGAQNGIALAPNGTLSRAVSDLSPGFRPIQRPADEPRGGLQIPGLTLDWLEEDTPAQPQPQPTRSGRLIANSVGFYINNTDIIAASESLAACRTGAFRHVDGAELRVIKSLDALGLTVLSSAKRSSKWVYIGQSGLTRDQKGLYSVGIASGGWKAKRLEQQAVQLVGTADIGRGQVRYVTSVQAGKRTSGAPILGNDRTLSGVIIGTVQMNGLSKRQRREVQAYSFAVAAPELAEALTTEGIMFRSNGSSRGARNADSKSAISNIFCEN